MFATARSASTLQDLADKGIGTLALTVDDEDSVRHCAAEVEERVGDRGLDFLINNAGQGASVICLAAEPSVISSYQHS